MRRLLTLAAVIAASAASAQACGRCSSMTCDGFLLPEDDALQIALKTHEAAVAGKLDADPQGIPLTAMARWWAKMRLPAALGTVHIVALDTGEKCGVRWTPKGPVVFVDVSGPSDTMVATTRRTLQTVIDGKMSLDEAVALNLARLDRASPHGAKTASTLAGGK